MLSQQITDYILQHRDTYTREAIDRQLLDAGYAQADIQAAWDALGAAEQQPQPYSQAQVPHPPEIPLPPSSRWGDEYTVPEYKPKRVVSSPIFWTVMIGFIVLSYGLPGLMAVLAPRDQYGSPNYAPLSVGFYGGLLMQLVAIVGGIIALRRNRPFGMGLLIGVLMTVVVLPFCALAIGLGVCLVMLGSFRY